MTDAERERIAAEAMELLKPDIADIARQWTHRVILLAFPDRVLRHDWTDPFRKGDAVKLAGIENREHGVSARYFCEARGATLTLCAKTYADLGATVEALLPAR